MRVWKASGTLDINKAMGRARRRMENRVIWIAVLFTVQFSGILCRNPYYEYYYSRYHKDHSTTEAISSSTSDNSYKDGVKSSVSDYTSLKGITGVSPSTTDDTSLENVTNSTVDHGTSVHTNVPVLQYGDPYNPSDMQYAFALRTGIIIGCFLFFFLGSCCLFCCLRKRFSGRTNTGFIIRSVPETAFRQQPPVMQQNQQPVVAQHHQHPPQYIPPYPDERTHLFPPEYQPVPGQQQYPPAHYQYASTEHENHNPPEAPPPYEYPTKF